MKIIKPLSAIVAALTLYGGGLNVYSKDRPSVSLKVVVKNYYLV